MSTPEFKALNEMKLNEALGKPKNVWIISVQDKSVNYQNEYVIGVVDDYVTIIKDPKSLKSMLERAINMNSDDDPYNARVKEVKLTHNYHMDVIMTNGNVIPHRIVIKSAARY